MSSANTRRPITPRRTNEETRKHQNWRKKKGWSKQKDAFREHFCFPCWLNTPQPFRCVKVTVAAVTQRFISAVLDPSLCQKSPCAVAAALPSHLLQPSHSFFELEARCCVSCARLHCFPSRIIFVLTLVVPHRTATIVSPHHNVAVLFSSRGSLFDFVCFHQLLAAELLPIAVAKVFP